MQLKINKIQIDALRKKAIKANKRIYIFDTKLTGFGCMSTPTGMTSYFIEYRMSGRKRRKTIGRHGVLTPDQARRHAQALLGDIARGIDISVKEQRISKVESVLVAYLKHKAKPTRYWFESEQTIRRDASSILKRDIKNVSRADIARLIDRVSVRSKSTGRALFSSLRPMFSWAAERGYIEISPFQNLKPPALPSARDRVLSNDELKAIWSVSDQNWFPYGPIVKLLILTGQRRSEVAGIRRGEIIDNVWTIPPSRTKNGKKHEVDLHPLAIEILNSLPFTHEIIFSSNGQTPPNGFSRAKRKLDTQLEIDDWRLHDLRRTCASGMAALGVLPNVIEKVLNHQSGLNAGLVGVYQRHQYRDERKAALLIWGNKVQNIIAT